LTAANGDVKNFFITKTYSTKFASNDVIEITAAGELNTPIGIIASIHYLDSKSNLIEVITDESWTCDGKAPMVQNLNGDNTSPFFILKKQRIQNVSDKAAWIWENSMTKTSTTCKITLP